MLDEFRAVVRGPDLPPSRRSRCCRPEWTHPDYWVRHVRDTVRFADGVRALARPASPASSRSAPTACSPPWPRRRRRRLRSPATRRARRDRAVPQPSGCFASPASSRTGPPCFPAPPRRPADLRLPAQRFWPAPAGQPAARRPGRAGRLRRGRVHRPDLDARTHPWLADHVVMGRRCCPARRSWSWRCVPAGTWGARGGRAGPVRAAGPAGRDAGARPGPGRRARRPRPAPGHRVLPDGGRRVDPARHRCADAADRTGRRPAGVAAGRTPNRSTSTASTTSARRPGSTTVRCSRGSAAVWRAGRRHLRRGARSERTGDRSGCTRPCSTPRCTPRPCSAAPSGACRWSGTA